MPPRSSTLQTVSIRIAATFTAEPMVPVLEAWLNALGMAPDVSVAPFNQVLQQLLDPESLLSTNRGGVNVVLVRASDLAADNVARARSAAREVAAALSEASSRDGIRTLAMACPGPDGGEIDSTFAADLADQIQHVTGVEALDARWLDRLYPVGEPFDPEADAAARIPYGEAMFASMGTLLARRIAALRRKPCKVIAVDCDNTLWSGVCGEVGPLGVVIDPPRQTFQRFLMKRRAEGYLLCLVSKNNPEDVEEVFRRNAGMLIPREASGFTTMSKPASRHAGSHRC